MEKLITLQEVMDIINEYSNKIAGCGNGRTVLELMIKKLQERYGE